MCNRGEKEKRERESRMRCSAVDDDDNIGTKTTGSSNGDATADFVVEDLQM